MSVPDSAKGAVALALVNAGLAIWRRPSVDLPETGSPAAPAMVVGTRRRPDR